MKVSSTVMIISAICLAVTLINSNSDMGVAFHENIISQGPDVLCGQTSYNYGNNSAKLCAPLRIIGSCPAKLGQFPFQVSVFDKLNNFFCGGIMLDEEHILTAAHCFNYRVPSTPETTIVTIGDHLRSSDDVLLKTTTRMVFKLTSDGYGSVNRPCMPNSGNITYREGDNLFVSGWGKIDRDCPVFEDTLRWVNVPYVSLKKCQESYGLFVTEDHLCTGYDKERHNAYYGDSGGPLVRQIEGNRFELVRIVCGGKEDAMMNESGVYTRVASFINWINATL